MTRPYLYRFFTFIFIALIDLRPDDDGGLLSSLMGVTDARFSAKWLSQSSLKEDIAIALGKHRNYSGRLHNVGLFIRQMSFPLIWSVPP